MKTADKIIYRTTEELETIERLERAVSICGKADACFAEASALDRNRERMHSLVVVAIACLLVLPLAAMFAFPFFGADPGAALLVSYPVLLIVFVPLIVRAASQTKDNGLSADDYRREGERILEENAEELAFIPEPYRNAKATAFMLKAAKEANFRSMLDLTCAYSDVRTSELKAESARLRRKTEQMERTLDNIRQAELDTIAAASVLNYLKK